MISKELEKELKPYFRSISYALPYSYSKKKKYFLNLKSEISSYVEENPDAKLEDIKENFGTPGEIMDSILETEGGDKILHSLKVGRWIKRVVLVTCILLVVIYTAIWIKDYCESVSFRHGYFVETIEEYDLSDSSD